jgi:hypothetical protein
MGRVGFVRNAPTDCVCMQRPVLVFRLRGRCTLPNSTTMVYPFRRDHLRNKCRLTRSSHSSLSRRCMLGTTIGNGRLCTVERSIHALTATMRIIYALKEY